MHGLVTINYTNLFSLSNFFRACFLAKFIAKTIFSVTILYFDDDWWLFFFFKYDSFIMEITWEVAMIWSLQRFCKDGVKVVFHFPFPTT